MGDNGVWCFCSTCVIVGLAHCATGQCPPTVSLNRHYKHVSTSAQLGKGGMHFKCGTQPKYQRAEEDFTKYHPFVVQLDEQFPAHQQALDADEGKDEIRQHQLQHQYQHQYLGRIVLVCTVVGVVCDVV